MNQGMTNALPFAPEACCYDEARLRRCGDEAELAPLIAGLLTGTRLIVPPGLPAAWVPGGLDVLYDEPPLDAARLDTSADAVLTGCSVAIAETGTIVLDAGSGQGRRVLTLIPDQHICVVRVPGDIVAGLPEALSRLDPVRPVSSISISAACRPSASAGWRTEVSGTAAAAANSMRHSPPARGPQEPGPRR